MTVGSTLRSTNLFSSAAPTEQAPAQQRDPAKLWLNIGFRHVIKNAAGEDQEVFIQIPFGLPIDTMKEIAVPRKEGNFKDMVSAQNALLKELRDFGFSLAAGETSILEGLEIQIVHVSDEVAEPTNNIVVPKFGAKA